MDNMTMINFFKNNILYIAGGLAGAVGGFLYWKFVGCSSGTCKITSSPINSSLYFGLMGSLAFGMFKTKSKENDNK
jgi:hypothetical protein